MNGSYTHNGYEESIRLGVQAARSFRNGVVWAPEDALEGIAALKKALDDAEAVVIGAGAGMSTAAGFLYTGERFERYFGDLSARFGYTDMYSGGFCSYPSDAMRWAFWSRYVWINRYNRPQKRTYDDLFALVKDKNYFVITTNVDHQFQQAGFDKERLFYTQGDYGLWQCSLPCHDKVYDNKEQVRAMVLAQGFSIAEDGQLLPPLQPDRKTDFSKLSMEVPEELVPHCPVCGRPMAMNLRSDDTFVEPQGWHDASARYSDFLRKWSGRKIVFLEIGIGGNTPVIVKYPFWGMTLHNAAAVYACLNYDQAFAPKEIAQQSILVAGDTHEVLQELKKL